MKLLDPSALAWAAALTIPPLTLLYFLKLKRAAREVSSTLLWKKAIEDLRVNAPFQRLRSSLLFFLQLLVLLAAAFALGKPMWKAAPKQTNSMILLVDQSASMTVRESDGRTRLEHAKEQARRAVDNLADGTEAMVISFSDRAHVVSSFESNRKTLKALIDSIEPTHGPSRLADAIRLAEAYAQTAILSEDESGASLESRVGPPPADVVLFTDGRIEDQRQVAAESIELSQLQVHNIGLRSDNLAILAMDARRNHESPDRVEVTATVGNFSEQPASSDLVLRIDGKHVDVQTVAMQAYPAADANSASPKSDWRKVVTFDAIEYPGAAIVEVELRGNDALAADDKAWAVLTAPRRLKVLCVVERNPPLQDALRALPIDVSTLTPSEYEQASDAQLVDGKRSAFDVVILDRCSTSRLPPGNYFFWEGAPNLVGSSIGDVVKNEVIFNWDENHPILRHVGIESLEIGQWRSLTVPKDAASLIEGQSTTVLAHFRRGPSQFLVCAFSLVVAGDGGDLRYNTDWTASVDYLLFMYNSLEYLASNLASIGRTGNAPGEVVSIPATAEAPRMTVTRPDGIREELDVANKHEAQYVNTRFVGIYLVESGGAVRQFPVNLFNASESNVKPSAELTLGTEKLSANRDAVAVSSPAWRFAVGALMILLVIEWIVFNRRVFVC